MLFSGQRCVPPLYYPVMEREGNIRLMVSGSRYEGKERGIGKFYNKIELGYFED